LQDTAFHSEESVGVGDIDLWEEVVQRPGVRDRRAAMCHDDQGTLAPEEVDKELEEGIDGECLEATR
jgi:hypothetical protein